MSASESRVALVTGGARGIGWSTASGLVDRGWRVAAIDLHPEAIPDGAPGDDQLERVALDVRDRRGLDSAVDRFIRRWGRIDGLVCSAGGQRHAPFEAITEEDW